MTAPPFAYFGGKTILAPRIAAMLPQHGHYVEPFGGSLAVLLAKSPSRMETVNDLDGDLMNFWRVLRDRPDELERMCALTPHSRAEFDTCRDRADEPSDVERARRIFVQYTQGRGSVGVKSGWRHYVKPAGGTSMPDYLVGYLSRISAAAARLQAVSLECRPALDLIESYGRDPEVLLYVDPPYLGTARADGDESRSGTKRYRHEMLTDDEHRELAEQLRRCHAAVVLSGYASELYDGELYADWHRTAFRSGTGQGPDGWSNRVEVLWSNREPHPTLFSIDEKEWRRAR